MKIKYQFAKEVRIGGRIFPKGSFVEVKDGETVDPKGEVVPQIPVNTLGWLRTSGRLYRDRTEVAVAAEAYGAYAD